MGVLVVHSVGHEVHAAVHFAPVARGHIEVVVYGNAIVPQCRAQVGIERGEVYPFGEGAARGVVERSTEHFPEEHALTQ